MPVQNPFPLEIIDKVNSPALQAWFQQFGEEGYLSADEINTIVTALNYLHENGGGSTLITTNRRTSSHTLALTDANKLVEMNVATANNLTVPPNASVAFPIGTPIDISQYGAGVTTIVAGAGVTIRSANNWYKINAQFAAASLLKIAENEWYLFGNLNA